MENNLRMKTNIPKLYDMIHALVVIVLLVVSSTLLAEGGSKSVKGEVDYKKISEAYKTLKYNTNYPGKWKMGDSVAEIRGEIDFEERVASGTDINLFWKYTDITDEQLELFSHLPNLVGLKLAGCYGLTAKSIDSYRNMKDIELLDTNMKVHFFTAETLQKTCEGLKKLKRIYTGVKNVDHTSEFYEKFLEQHPGIEINRGYGGPPGSPSRLAADKLFRSLFNGKDLEGWDGNPELWSVENGVITGKTTGPDQLTYNQFLIWRGGEVKNFILHAKIKVRGNNSGIQYRSRELPQNGKWSVGGYQCDVHPKTENNAMVYDEKGRGIIVRNGQDVVVDPEGQKWLVAERDPVEVDVAEWNEYTIVARGNHLIHRINGTTTINLIDHDEKFRSLAGLIAFQLHRGPAMTIQIKDVKFRELPGRSSRWPLISYADTSIPDDARLIEKRGDKGKNKGKAAPSKPAVKPTSKTPAKPKQR